MSIILPGSGQPPRTPVPEGSPGTPLWVILLIILTIAIVIRFGLL